ncbi:hypothetical protein BGZ65_001481 [Modicella reniformis]|uniref:ABC transporter domain-containing protein n=1 Tax=Modicella reniformis TaxID=1440133 RepID=A0A9P6IM73_9FUNG|nr:hypothetical protein BGZ65_001481 [Modicella reniformis]
MGSEDRADSLTGQAKRPNFNRAKSSRIKEDDNDLAGKDEVDEEITADGKVGWPVYKFYISSLDTIGVITLICANVSYTTMEINAQLWLQRWGNENLLSTATNTEPAHTNSWWILTYFAWILASALMFTFLIAYLMVFLAYDASKKLHAAMFAPLMRSPMNFFDITSSGKIVNRFSHNINMIDIINLSMPELGYFLVSSRELKRLDTAAHSPIYAHFGETLAGLTSIRAFQDSDRFAIDATALLDRSQQTAYLTNATTRWLQIVLDAGSVFILTVVALMAILQRETVHSGLFSIVLSQIGTLTGVMSRILVIICDVETSIVSVERVREYSQLTTEARDVIPDSKTDEAWPQAGKTTFNRYSTRYREGLTTTIENGGENMSLGQRQLMSLARAMLAKNTRVLCLDEATAAIDIETDNAIQRALRWEFVKCTVLTIAHRINTIMDSDRILVLEKGRVAEFETPKTLLQNQEGIFYSLANKSGNV